MDSTLNLTPHFLNEKEDCISSAIDGGIDIAVRNHKGSLPDNLNWREEVKRLIWEHFKKEADGREISNRYFLHWAQLLAKGYLRYVDPRKAKQKVEG